MKNFIEWMNESSTNIEINMDKFKESIHDAMQKNDYSADYFEKDFAHIVDETKRNMEILRSKVNDVISKLPYWHTNTVLIEPMANQDRFGVRILVSTNAQIFLGHDTEENMAPSFTVFIHDEKILIDDILEGGDRDFFRDNQTQADYFALIDGLKYYNKPKENKILTLYTARPRIDREKIQQNQQMPLNIFLANSLSHIQGLSKDLSGNRDIWIVKINSKYLTQTLDGPIKYYQLTTDEAPMEVSLLDS